MNKFLKWSWIVIGVFIIIGFFIIVFTDIPVHKNIVTRPLQLEKSKS